MRRIHTLVVETEEHLSKIKWIRSEKVVRASVVVARRQDQTELKEVIVVVPAKWKFVKRIEALRDSAEEDKLSELGIWSTYTPCFCGDEDIHPQGRWAEVNGRREPTTSGNCPGEVGIEPVNTRMGKTSKGTRCVQTGWKRCRVEVVGRLEIWFPQLCEGIGPLHLGQQGHGGKQRGRESEGLYSLLTSYLRQRPSKLIRHVKSENGFEAWQTLLKEMQPATRARALALLSQLSRIQFAEGKTVRAIAAVLRLWSWSTSAFHRRSTQKMQKWHPSC